MIDQDILKITNDRIRIEIEEQNSNLHSEIGRIKAEMSDRGLLQGSATITRIADLCINTIKNRAQLIWQTLFRFITTTCLSYSPDLADKLKDIVAQNLSEKLDDLAGHIKQIAKFAGSQSLSEKFIKDLENGRDQALAKVGTEIDLFVHSLKRKADDGTNGSSSTVFNIYSPVGSIQTGDSSIANITQNIDTEVKEQIRKALEEINSTLTQFEVKISLPKSELIEIVQESQLEIQKEKPNITRLRSLLATVGTSIQMVSSLKPAYEILKQALTFLGISLP